VTSPNAEATTAETFDTAPPADSNSAATSQSAITAEIVQIEAGYRASGVTELQPRLDYPPYRSTILRHPTKDPRHVDPETIELWSPCFGHRDVHAIEADLTIQHGGEPIGERMIVTGRVLDGNGRPVRGQLAILLPQPEVRYARLTLMNACSLALLTAGDFTKPVIAAELIAAVEGSAAAVVRPQPNTVAVS